MPSPVSLSAPSSNAAPFVAQPVRLGPGGVALDPRAEAALLAEEYRQSRLQRLLAVRRLADQQAARTRATFRAAQARQEEQERTRREEAALAEAARAQQQLQARLAQAQAQLGEAQRNAAEQTEQALQQQAAASARAHVLQQHTQSRYSKALTLVQQRAAQARAAKDERRALKEASKQAEKLVRAQLQRTAARQAATTPAHLLAYTKVSSAPSTPATASASGPLGSAAVAQTPAHQPHLSVRGRGGIPGGISPYTPSQHSARSAAVLPLQEHAHDIDADADGDDENEEDEEEPSALAPALPVPSPHPSSARRPQMQSQHHPVPSTPAASATVATALDFSSPPSAPPAEHGVRAPLSEKTKALHAAQDERKQRALLAHHDVQTGRHRVAVQRRSRSRDCSTERMMAGSSNNTDGSRSTAVVRGVQERAFDIVLKQGQNVVTQRIGSAAFANTARAASSSSPQKLRGSTISTTRKDNNNNNNNNSRSRSVSRLRPRTAPAAVRRRPVPVLVPNAAFFQQLQQQQQQASPVLFNPVVQRSALGGAVTWTIPAESDGTAIAAKAELATEGPAEAARAGEDASQRPVLRGLQLAAAHAQQQQERAEAEKKPASVAPDSIEPVMVDVGTRFYAQGDVPSADIVRQHGEEKQQQPLESSASDAVISTPGKQSDLGDADVFSSPLFPLASAAAALASAAAARVAASRAGTPAKPSPVQQDLDQQLRSLLQSHLFADAAATQRLFSPAGSAPVASSFPAGPMSHHPSSRQRPIVESFEPSALSDSDDEFEQSLRHMQAEYDDDVDSGANGSPGAFAAFAGSPGALNHSQAHHLSFTSPAAASTDSSMLSLSPGAPALQQQQQQHAQSSKESAMHALLFGSPTAATDLFLEQLAFALEQERLQAAQVDEQLHQEAKMRDDAHISSSTAHSDAQRQQLMPQHSQEDEETASVLDTPAPLARTQPRPYTDHAAGQKVGYNPQQQDQTSPTSFLHHQQQQQQQPQFTLTLNGAPMLPKQSHSIAAPHAPHVAAPFGATAVPLTPASSSPALQATHASPVRTLFHTPTSSSAYKRPVAGGDEAAAQQQQQLALARSPYAQSHSTPVSAATVSLGLPPPTPVQAQALALVAQLSQLSPEQLRAQKPVHTAPIVPYYHPHEHTHA